ncbi:hypothetical protein EEDFHM_03919 [Methylorubrum populi]
MPPIEITSRVTRRSLMNRTKDELATRVLELMDLLDRERARHAADAEALRAVIHHLRPAAAIVRIDEPTTGRHRYELLTHVRPERPLAAFVDRVLGEPWEPARTRDADLPAVVSPCS